MPTNEHLLSRKNNRNMVCFAAAFAAALLSITLLAPLLAPNAEGQSRKRARTTPPTAPTPSPTTPTPSVLAIEAKPSIVQPDGILTLSFNPAIKPKSITIGPKQIGFTSTKTTALEVKVPTDTPLGRQNIAVTAEGAESPLTSSVIVAPLVLGLRARKGAPIEESRVVIPRGDVILQLSESIPSEIRNKLVVKLRSAEQTQPVTSQTPSTPQPSPTPKEPQRIEYVIPENDYLILRMPADLELTTYTVELSVAGSDVILDKRPKLGVVYTSSVYWRASLNLLVPIIILYVFFRWFYKVPEGQPRYTFLGVLLLEPENQTYSLSRAQFLAWLIAIVWCYLFLYFAHGYVEQAWAYPSLGNATYTFLISLGTLIAAQVTTKTRGPNGAGEIHPSIADLIVHGGVLALDRVQQVVWTLVAIGMFVRITVSSFGAATGLPDIPNELLALMGLSSAGYLGGKIVRGPGPVIDQVTPRSGSVILNIRGKHISKDAFIWLDGVNQQKEKINIKTSDPDNPQFVTEIELTLDTSIDQWYATEHVITVVNADAQRADWRSSPQVLSVTAGAIAGGKAPLTITGAYLEKDATVDIGDAPNVTAQHDKDNPNLFTATVDESWLRASHQITVTSGGQKATSTYTPSAAG